MLLVVACTGSGAEKPSATPPKNSSPAPGSVEPVPGVGNGLIAFLATDKGGGQQIYTMDRDGTDRTQLTRIPGLSAAGLSWAPSGRKLVFGRGMGEGHSELEVMNADGTGLHAITHDFTVYDSPAWSPDGSRIAASAGGDLILLRANGGKRQRLLQSPRACSAADPSWSPDGNRIAYSWYCYADGSIRTSIRVIDPNRGGWETLLGPTRANAGVSGREYMTPAWSPDGKRIAFVTTTHTGGASSGLYVMTDDGGDSERLGPRRSESVAPTWSPDGTKMAFLLYGPGRISQVAVMSADGTDVEPLTDAPQGVSAVAWQPVPQS